MTPNRPRLLLLPGVALPQSEQAEALRALFEIVQVHSLTEARGLAGSDEQAFLLLPNDHRFSLADTSTVEDLTSIVENLGEGSGLVGADGTLLWANRRLRQYDDNTRHIFVQTCLQALRQFSQPDHASVPLNNRPQRKFSFTVGDMHYEAIVSIAAVQKDEHRAVSAVAGFLWEVTASRQLQSKLDALDAAGTELLRIEPASIARLNMAERLKLLEEKIVWAIREILDFEDFEIRLIDRETNQLELVIAQGISPLRIGEVFHAEPEHSGISGHVATTGRSYICDDTTKDPLYREGLDDAASSLTVPLRLHDRVIGIFNIESKTPAAFTDNDRRFAEIFGRYIAMAMHILDLLVVERYTTNEQVAENVLSELNNPLGDITSQAAALRSAVTDQNLRDGLDRILEAAGGIRRRLEACMAGPRSILGAEQALQQAEPDPLLVGKQVIVADNEQAVRDAIANLLRQRGCEVAVCSNGAETIEKLREADSDHRPFDMVISDIRMPDRNGYEVFRATKEICAGTPVILITGFGYDPHHSIVRASQEGLHSFLFKPLRATQLLEVISSAFSPA